MQEILEVQEKTIIFASETLKVSMDGNHTERLSQESECREDGENSLLESASAFAQRVLEEIEALAGTTACKSVQLVRLKKRTAFLVSSTIPPDMVLRYYDWATSKHGWASAKAAAYTI
jgi:hypothetical protein